MSLLTFPAEPLARTTPSLDPIPDLPDAERKG